MLKKRSLYVAIFILSLLIFNVFVVTAREVTYTFKDFANDFNKVGKNIYFLFQNEYVVYIATIILTYILVFAVLIRVIARIRIFEGEAGVSANSSGKMLAHSLTGLICLGVFAFRKNVLNFINSFLLPFGLMGAFLIALTVFLLAYKMIEVKRAKFWWALLLSSITLIIYGSLVSS